MLINECIFLFTGRWAYDLGGGGGSYMRRFTVFPYREQELYIPYREQELYY